MSNRAEAATHPPPKRETAPSGKGAAVDQVTKAAELSQASYPNDLLSAIALIGDPKKRAAVRMFAFAVAGDSPDIWVGVSAHGAVALAEKEIALTAWAALRALDPDVAEETVASALGKDVGPLPTFMDLMDDARFWASLASRNTLKAYALASFEAMHPKDRAAFLDHIGERRAA